VIKNAIARYKTWVDNGRSDVYCEPESSTRSCNAWPLKLVFYFNGGLNTKRVVMESAAGSYRLIEDDEMYPIYMVWPTGGRQSYLEDVTRVRAGRLTKWSNPSTLASTPVRPASDLLRGLASTPAAWATSAFELYQTGFGIGSEAYTMKRDWEMHVSKGQPIANEETVIVNANTNLYFSPWKLRFPDLGAIPDGEPEADLLVQDGSTAIKELPSFAYHAATAPVRALTTLPMVGLGEAGWRNMVRRTRTSVRAADEFPDEFAEESEARGREDPSEARTSEDPNSVEIGLPGEGCGRPLEGEADKLRRCYPRGSGGFARVFQWLESCMTGRLIGTGADGCPLSDLAERDYRILRNARIVMIGHSMGAIIVNELLQLFPDLPYESLVYMAGAASVRDTSRAVTPVLVDNLGCTKFYGLMLHPMNEARESTGYGLLPSGSLLVYVDEFLEVPKTVPDRTVGQWRNLRATRHVFFPEQARRWMLFHVFDRAEGRPENGKMPNPTTHGSFNDEGVPFWKEAFWKPKSVMFPKADANCEDVFAGKMRLAELTAQATMQEWQSALQEVARGRTIAITRGGETIARIVPVPEKEQ
jgi:hypothetical protein